MKYYCLQLTKDDCGFAVVKMMLSFFHHDKNYLFMEQDLLQSNYSFLDLKNIARDNNLELRGYEVQELEQVQIFPLIGLIKLNGNAHYILIEKVTKKHIYFFDPLEGKQKIEKEDFYRIFTGFILIKDQVTKTNCKKYIKLFSYKYSYISLIFNTLQVFLLFLASFIIEDHFKILFISILFLSLYVMNNLINSFLLKDYDHKEIYPSIESNITKEKVSHEFNLKKSFFSYQLNIINASTILAFLCFLLLINDLKNIFLILVLFLFTIFRNRVLSEVTKPLVYKSRVLENELSIEAIKKSNELSYQFSNIYNIFNIIKLSIMLITIIIICYLNHNFAASVYYFFISIAIVDYIDKIVSLKNDVLQINRDILIHKQNK